MDVDLTMEAIEDADRFLLHASGSDVTVKTLVTGGAGFIESNFLNLVVPRHPEHQFVCVENIRGRAGEAAVTRRGRGLG